MSKTQIRITMGCCLLVAAVLSWAQAVRKPGLWEMTSTTTWQKTPLPPGMTMPQGAANPFAATTRTSQVCLTQDMVNKYGAPVPTLAQNCTLSNLVVKATSMTADMTCSGRMNITATMESSWPDGNTATGKIHVTGTMQMGANSAPVEFTVQSTSTYKSPDCGNVQPMQMPPTK